MIVCVQLCAEKVWAGSLSGVLPAPKGEQNLMTVLASPHLEITRELSKQRQSPNTLTCSPHIHFTHPTTTPKCCSMCVYPDHTHRMPHKVQGYVFPHICLHVHTHTPTGMVAAGWQSLTETVAELHAASVTYNQTASNVEHGGKIYTILMSKFNLCSNHLRTTIVT